MGAACSGESALKGLQCPYLQGLPETEGDGILLQTTHIIRQYILAHQALPWSGSDYVCKIFLWHSHSICPFVQDLH